MRTLALAAVLTSPAFSLADDKPKPKLEIDLTTTRKEIYPDEIPVVKAVIHNAGKSDVEVVKYVDGALHGLRSVVQFKWVVKRDGQLVGRRRDVVRIDNEINTLTLKDIVTVPAGKDVNLEIDYFETYYDLKTPGKYTIELRYELDPTAGDRIDAKAKTALQNLTGVSLEGKTELTILPFPLAVNVAEEKLKLAQAKHLIAMQFTKSLAQDPTSTAAERDVAAERLKRATANVNSCLEEYNAKMTEFRKKRDEDRMKK